MSVPGGFTEAGLPIGVQFQGRHFQEEMLLKVGFNLEQGLQLGKRVLDL